jgi:DNA polymerase
MRHLSIDIETYSDIDIKKSGAYRYAASPNFEVLLLAYAYDDGPVSIIDFHAPVGQSGMPQSLYHDLKDSSVVKHAYNAAFEWYCLSRFFRFTAQQAANWLSQWRCTLAAAYYCGYAGSLGVVGEAVGIPQDKRKLGTGMNLIRTFCVPQKPTKANGGRTRTLPHHEPEKWDLFKRYCMQDVEAEREIAQRLSPWPMPPKEQRLWQLDCLGNAAGVLVDKQLVDGALYCGEAAQAELLAEAKQISGLDNPKSVPQLLKWLKEELEDDEIPDLRKATVKDILGRGVASDRAERMLEIRQQIGKTSTKKYDAMRAAQGGDGRVRGLLQYYGASRTGRWAGRLVQVQNLPRNYLETLDFARELVVGRKLDAVRLMYGNVPDTLSQLIRTAFIPSPGKMFLVADFSAIEARVIAWLAGEKWRMDVFATHGKIYEASASAMFGVPLEKIVKGEPEYALRQKGKVAELALGYGGGPGALTAMGALQQGLTEDELPDIVARWRKASPNIVQLWRDLESAALRCVRDCEPVIVRGLLFRREWSPAHGQDFMTIKLPVGRQLFYPKPYISVNKFGKDAVFFLKEKRDGKDNSTWGGTLTENVTQAIARDCLAEILLRLDAAGYQTAFHVHDEIIVECEEDRLSAILDMMKEPIPWAPGLILKGDGFSTQNWYRKD